MRTYILYTIFGFMLALTPVTVHGQGPDAVNAPPTTFFHALNDVPVMTGLRELPDESVNFDKPEGRIINATAVSDHLKPETIRNFYAQTLPQLGWQPEKEGSFMRDRERLKLIIDVKEGVSIAHFQVEPR